jgi:hypothetical protein
MKLLILTVAIFLISFAVVWLRQQILIHKAHRGTLTNVNALKGRYFE